MRIEGSFAQVFGDGKSPGPVEKIGVRRHAWRRLPPDQQKIMTIQNQFVRINPSELIERPPHANGNDIHVAKVEIIFADGSVGKMDCWLSLLEHPLLPQKIFGWGVRLPHYRPMAGYRLLHEGVVLHKARFESKQPTRSIRVEEVPNGEGLWIKWVFDAVPGTGKVGAYWIRYSLDGGLIWKPQYGAGDLSPGGVSGWNDGGILIEKADLDQNPHPLIELWITQGMTLTKLRYVVGEGGIPLKQ
ncbi:MAG: hypothetical protein IPL96_03195 [Holophagaceae bacterium]|nr:hypothetical protein [Holophagaceae bacterium]